MYLTCNFGGFVPLSTVDLPGKSACILFLRGCPNHCPWCHNPQLLRGCDEMPVESVKEYIHSAEVAVSAVVFSGGEPTYQPVVLRELLHYAKSLGLYTSVHTSGIFTETLAECLAYEVVDHISLDIKTSWEHYPNILGNSGTDAVKSTLFFCRAAFDSRILQDFTIIHTLFPATIHAVMDIAQYAPEVPFVIQQGNYQDGRPTLSPEYITEIAKACGELRGDIKIRTREFGEQQIVPKRSLPNPCQIS